MQLAKLNFLTKQYETFWKENPNFIREGYKCTKI